MTDRQKYNSNYTYNYSNLTYNGELITIPVEKEKGAPGYKTRKFRVHRFYKEYNIDGIKKFLLLRIYNIIGIRLITNIRELKISALKVFTYTNKILIQAILQVPVITQNEISGIKKVYYKTEINLAGIKNRINTLQRLDIINGIKKIDNIEDLINLTATKRFNLIQDKLLIGIKRNRISEEKIIQGKRDIFPILTSLNLLGE